VTRSQIASRTLAAIVAAVVFTYVADYLVLRIRMLHPTPTAPFETMTRTRLLAIPMKNGKYEFQIDEENPRETLTCVHAIFPHFGNDPCWHLKPHLKDPVKID